MCIYYVYLYEYTYGYTFELCTTPTALTSEKHCYLRNGNVYIGAGVAQRLCNGLPRNDTEFDSRWRRCKNRGSRPSQVTVNGGAVSK